MLLFYFLDVFAKYDKNRASRQRNNQSSTISSLGTNETNPLTHQDNNLIDELIQHTELLRWARINVTIEQAVRDARRKMQKRAAKRATGVFALGIASGAVLALVFKFIKR